MAGTVPKGVPVYSPEGELGTIPQLDQDALIQGYRPAAPEDVSDALREAKYGTFGQQVATGAEAAGSALTFGLSPKLETMAGITTPEDIRGRAEENPISHAIGTGVGLAAPLVLTGGAAAPAEAGAGALRGAAELTAPALISRAGRGVAGALEGAGVPGMLGKVAGGAAEGALYASADQAEKALLGDPQLTWEKAASDIGLGALLGGAVSGGTQAAAKGLGWMMTKATAGLESIGTHLAEGDPTVIKMMVKSKGQLSALEEVAPGASDAIAAATPETAEFIIKNHARIARLEGEFPGLTDVLARVAPEKVEEVLGNWGKLLKTPEARIEVGKSMEQAVSSAYSSIEDGLQLANREARPAETRELLGFGPNGWAATPKEAQAEGSRIVGEVERLSNEMRSKPDLFPPMYPAKLEAARDGLLREIESGEPAGIFSAINKAKQQIDPLAKFGKLVPPEHRDAISAVSTLRGTLKDSLEDAKLWGPAADRQAGFNAAQNAYFTARTRLQKLLMQQRPLPTGRVTFEAAPTKVNSWINLMADGRGEAKSQVFGDYLKAAQNLTKEMETSGVPDAQQLSGKLKEIVEQTKEIQQRGAITQIVKMAQGHEILSSGPAIPAPHAMALKAARYIPGGVGHVIGLTSDISGTIQKVRRPSMMVGVLSTLEKLAKKSSAKLQAAADGLFKSGLGGAAAGEAAGSITERLAHGGMVGPENFADASSHLRDLAGSPDRLAERLSKETGTLGQHAPATADAARAFAARVVSHLAGKLPEEDGHQLLDAPFEPSGSELAEYHRHHEVAERGPLAVLEHAARGTLHPDHLEASATLYPKLHAEAQQLVAERLSEHLRKKEHVPIAMRETLGMLLGADLEHAQSPQAVLFAQQAMQAPAQPDQGGAPKASKPRQVQTKFSNRAATGSQQNSMSLSKDTT